MKTWPGCRMRNVSSSNAFGLSGKASPSRSSRCPREVHLDPLEVDDRRRRLDRDGLLRSPEQRPDPRRQLAKAERFRDVVVRAELQPDDLVELRVLGREHDDRDARLGPDDPADLDARQLREHHVEQDEVRTVGPEPGQCLASVGRRRRPGIPPPRARRRASRGGSSRRPRRGSFVPFEAQDSDRVLTGRSRRSRSVRAAAASAWRVPAAS